jgi:RNA polymerase sigma-70 factor (ECF subfamily)
MSTATATRGRDMGDEGTGRSRGASLIVEHGPALARVCMALLGDAREVERVLEAVARDAGAKKLDDAKMARAWIFGLARSQCANQLSKVPLRSATHATGPVTERLGARSATPARDALAKLKPTEREAVVLHTVGGLDIEEVAYACNVDVQVARSRISQGMQKLVEGGV